LNNPNFQALEFEGLKRKAGLNQSMGSNLWMTVTEKCNKIDLSRMIRSDGLIDIYREYKPEGI